MNPKHLCDECGKNLPVIIVQHPDVLAADGGMPAFCAECGAVVIRQYPDREVFDVNLINVMAYREAYEVVKDLALTKYEQRLCDFANWYANVVTRDPDRRLRDWPEIEPSWHEWSAENQ